MSHTPLTKDAETIRKEIKALISQADILEDDGKGNRMFGGEALSNKLFELKAELGVQVKFSLPLQCTGITDRCQQSWGWTLWEFSGPKKMGNKARQMYLVPLSEGSTITPGGDLVEGKSTFLTDEPILTPNARIIVITPKVNQNQPSVH